MKKALFAVLTLLMAGATSSAQTAIMGDMNSDGILDVADVSNLVSTILGEKAQVIIKIDTTTAQPKTYTVNGVSFKMMPVTGGTFQMGSAVEKDSDAYNSTNRLPVHNVTLGDYYIGETEVTQALWSAVMGGVDWNSTYGKGDNYPAYSITWDECQQFIQKLNALTGETFRMLTEAEWEYAARGGEKTHDYMYAGSDSPDSVAWYMDYKSSPYSTHEVASKLPNELGLYDMSGNVREWCADWYASYSAEAQISPSGPETGTYRVVRGGMWNRQAYYCHVWCRSYNEPTSGVANIGLRLAR